MKECPVCAETYEPSKSNQKYCSARCRTVATGARQRSRPYTEKTCRSCGQVRPIGQFLGVHTSCRDCEDLFAAGLRTCKKCGETKPLDGFHARQGPPGYDTRCKQCRAEWSKQHNQLPHIKQHKRDIKFRGLYGITLAEYNESLSRQGNACAICGRESTSTLHVDHDHVTGQVRDLLCLRCNALLGHCAEDPVILQAAAAYLERHSNVVSLES